MKPDRTTERAMFERQAQITRDSIAQLRREKEESLKEGMTIAADLIGKTGGCVFKDGFVYVSPDAEKRAILRLRDERKSV